MNFRNILALLFVTVPTVASSGSAHAQDPDTVIACETLIAARRIDAATGADRAAPLDAGCRRIPRRTIGPVEQRALIGGAPYECMTIADAGRCLWIVP